MARLTRGITLIDRHTVRLPGALGSAGLSVAEAVDYLDRAIATACRWFGGPADAAWRTQVAIAPRSKVMRHAVLRFYSIAIDGDLTRRSELLYILGYGAVHRVLHDRAPRGTRARLRELLSTAGSLQMMVDSGLRHEADEAVQSFLHHKAPVLLTDWPLHANIRLPRGRPAADYDTPRVAAAIRAVCTWDRFVTLGRDLSWPGWVANLGAPTLAGLARVLAPINEREQAVADPQLAVGYAWYVLGYSGDAAREFRRWLALHPNDVAAVEYLALALWGLGDLEGARAAYERALALAPDDDRIARNVASFRAAELVAG